ncbi:hypothetical protein NPIL_48951 [Nephila pilipes]|uniref:Mutator-like transposase domain-containing protein n=1 Tax=Nephila pilipes TaxID=299642 RepID=A0A8X6R1V9_NEPPI|nr:hypothetical protein NPIL_48951 [Nephila pilipes]
MTTIGQVYATTTAFCGMMDFPPSVIEKSFNNTVNTLQKYIKEVVEALMQKVALEEMTIANSSVIIIIVVWDGQWNASIYSCVNICTVIRGTTVKVTGAEMLYSYCKGCESWKGSHVYK